MARRSNRRSWIIKIAFIVIVIVSGAALARNGDLRNPFSVFSRLTSSNQFGGFERGERPEGFQPPADSTQGDGTAAAISPPEGFRRGERPQGGGRGEGRGVDDLAALNWSAVDGVLFDIWFIAAAAAVIMVLGPLVGKLIKKLRPPRRPQATATAV